MSTTKPFHDSIVRTLANLSFRQPDVVVALMALSALAADTKVPAEHAGTVAEAFEQSKKRLAESRIAGNVDIVFEQIEKTIAALAAQAKSGGNGHAKAAVPTSGVVGTKPSSRHVA